MKKKSQKAASQYQNQTTSENELDENSYIKKQNDTNKHEKNSTAQTILPYKRHLKISQLLREKYCIS
ncbi:MAG: hypothetical protein HEQ40_12235 [Lacibacter sp.]|jgi:hypothetical protein